MADEKAHNFKVLVIVNCSREEMADYLLTFYNNTTYNKRMDGSCYKQNVFNQQ